MGYGIEQNDSKAFKYFQKAAGLGNPIEMNNLGCHYRWKRSQTRSKESS